MLSLWLLLFLFFSAPFTGLWVLLIILFQLHMILTAYNTTQIAFLHFQGFYRLVNDRPCAVFHNKSFYCPLKHFMPLFPMLKGDKQGQYCIHYYILSVFNYCVLIFKERHHYRQTSVTTTYTKLSSCIPIFWGVCSYIIRLVYKAFYFLIQMIK